jgi:hypothetical protein
VDIADPEREKPYLPAPRSCSYTPRLKGGEKMSLRLILSLAMIMALPASALAVSYASGVSEAGTNVSFILNQDAANVDVVLDGGVSTLSLGALSKGTHNFDITGYSSYQIKVNSAETPGWTQISADATSTSFWSPLGISVNKHAWSPNFGKVYVSNASSGTTTFGRTTTSGIYALNADASDAGFVNGGKDWVAAGNLAPFKSTIGPDDHLYVTDFSNDLAFEFSGNMSSVTQLLDGTNKTSGQYVESIHVEGTQAGGDREVYLVDSHYLDARRGLIQYNLGGNATIAANDTGTQYIGPDYFGYYPRDVARDSNGDWYMPQYRYTAGEAPPITKFLDSATLPINTAEWEVDDTPIGDGAGAYGIDIFEPAGLVAFGSYYTGFVWIFDMDTGALIGSFDAGSRIREVAFDAAGNLYTVDNVTERMRIWSPGGNWLATTGSDGSFALVPEPATLVLLLGALPLLRRRR